MITDVRLIDANALRNEWLYNGLNEKVYSTNDFLDSIDEQPTINNEQIKWERDLAVEQLRNDYGVGLGEKKPIQKPLSINEMIEVISGNTKHPQMIYIEHRKEKCNSGWYKKESVWYYIANMADSAYIEWRPWIYRPTEEEKETANWKDE